MAKKKNEDRTAEELVQLIHDMIVNELNKRDDTCVIKICTVNDNGTYDVYIEPDEQTIIKGIPAASNIELAKGDYAYLYKFKNQINNSIIMTKIGRRYNK